jgi:hypothetical protein
MNQNYRSMHMKKATKYVGKKRRSCILNRTPPAGIHTHVSGGSSDQSTQHEHPHIWTSIIEAEVRRLQLRPLQIIWEKLRFYVGTTQMLQLSIGFIICWVLFGI